MKCKSYGMNYCYGKPCSEYGKCELVKKPSPTPSAGLDGYVACSSEVDMEFAVDRELKILMTNKVLGIDQRISELRECIGRDTAIVTELEKQKWALEEMNDCMTVAEDVKSSEAT